MTKDELLKECWRVRHVLEKGAKQHILPDDWFYHFPAGQCLVTSETLAIWLPRNGPDDIFEIVSGWYNGKSHAWIEHNGLIIDITADQFPEITQKVIVTEESKFHDMFTEDRKRRAIGKYSYNPSARKLLEFMCNNL